METIVTQHVIRDRIKEGMKETGISQTDIAKKFNIGREALNRKLNSSLGLTMDDLFQFCGTLNLDPSEFLEEAYTETGLASR